MPFSFAFFLIEFILLRVLLSLSDITTTLHQSRMAEGVAFKNGWIASNRDQKPATVRVIISVQAMCRTESRKIPGFSPR
ncbi:hypothetical protein Y710_00255 [Gordonia sp. QH-12]|nr:hypothetical protein Y710_00255 [Gordonia sp. QH-12]